MELTQILLKDNNQGHTQQYKRSDIAALFPYYGKTIEQLCNENASLLVWPLNKKDTDDDVEKEIVFDIVNTENPDDVRLRTYNVMGFIGINNLKIKIGSRFDNDNHDFFLHYMLQKVLSFNLFNLDYTNDDEAVFDLMMLMFPFYLKAALTQGLYREYQHREYNNSKVKGTIDVGRHLRSNIPFKGNIAYSLREYTYDNDLTQLIRHTIEFIRTKPLGKHILNKDKETLNNVRQIVENTTYYNKADKRRIIQKNLRPNRHPYYTAYRPLQSLCIQILRNDERKYGERNDELRGILFDGAWLWEEYVYTIIKNKGFKHSQNKKGIGKICLFNDSSGVRYPDFYNDNIVLDAKYKRFENMEKVSKVNRDDIHQLITYIVRLQCLHGGFVSPMENRQPSVPTSHLVGYDATLSIFSIEIPKADSFKEFCEKMKKSEDDFKQNLFSPQIH